MRRWLFLLPILVFVGFVAMLYARLGKDTNALAHAKEGRQLPAFGLPLLSEPSRVLTQTDLPKTPYLLNVWGSWCPTCHAEHPYLMDLAKNGVPMVGINYKDTRTNALAYLNQGGNPFIYSLADEDGAFALDLGLTGAPETFVIDGNGKIWLHIMGQIGEQNYPQIIAPCLDDLNKNAANPRCGV